MWRVFYTLFILSVVAGAYVPPRGKVGFHSQKGQDQWLVDVFQGKRDGYFVDLACNDPINLSNTVTLERAYNWTGLCIDGNPAYIRKYAGIRKCTPIHAVVDRREGDTVEFRTDNNALGGIVDDDVDNNQHYRGDAIARARRKNGIRAMTTENLQGILRKHNAPRVIDYLSLDVEGAEWRVLSSGVLLEYTFLVMTVERPPPKVNNLLRDRGYVYIKSVAPGKITESFYLHRTFPGVDAVPKEPFEQVPPKTR